MLQQMRKFTKSWVASIFMGVLALSFGVWGIADIFHGTTDTTAATVGKVSISKADFQREYQNLIQSESAQMHKELTPEDARKMGLDKIALEQMLGRTAISIEAQQLGLTVSDANVAAQIKAIPAFAGPTGNFDRNTFLRTINRMGFTERGFIETMRQDMEHAQLTGAVKDGLQAPAGYVRAFFAYINEMRAVHYVVMPASAAPKVPNPTDAQLTSYVAKHPKRFSTPEYREFSYAAVTPADVISELTVSDKELHNQYILNQDQYNVPEKRDIEQIPFPNEKAAAKARAEIAQGKSFDDIAAARGLKKSDVQLGELEEADLNGPRGKAAFALKAGEVSKPVKGLVGYVLLKVAKIVPGEHKTFEDVKETLRKQALNKLAQGKISDIINAFEDAMAGGDTFEAAAKKAGMKYVHVKAMDKSGLTPSRAKADVPANANFLAQVFAVDIGIAGDPFQTKDGSAYALKVDGDTPPKLKPLDQVRKKAQTEWIAERQRETLQAKAKSLAAEATKDKSLAAVAKELGAPELESPALERGTPADPFPAELIDRIFEAPPGTAVFGKSAKGDTYIVARITGVVHPPHLTMANPQYRQFTAQIGAQIGNDLPASFAMAARKQQGVNVHQKIVDSVTGAGS